MIIIIRTLQYLKLDANFINQQLVRVRNLKLYISTHFYVKEDYYLWKLKNIHTECHDLEKRRDNIIILELRYITFAHVLLSY